MKTSLHNALKRVTLLSVLTLGLAGLAKNLSADGPAPVPEGGDESGGIEAVALLVAGAAGMRLLQRKQ